MTLEEAEKELEGIIDRLDLDEHAPLFVLMKEYRRLQTLHSARDVLEEEL